MKLIKCPRCELNYINENETMCAVCRKDVRGEKEPEEMLELCSECGENPVVPGQEVCHLKKTVECPEYTHDQRGDADFLHPGRSLPGSKEQGDEKKGDDNHSDRSAGNKNGEKICS